MLLTGDDSADVIADALSNGVAATAKEQAQWTLHRLVPGRGVCNLATAVRVERTVRWWPLREALNHLLYRHSALRAVFSTGNGGVWKRFLPVDAEVPLSTHAAGEDELDGLLGELFATPFDVAGGPLMRAHLITLASSSVICLVMHHSITDDQTLRVIRREITLLYDAFAEAGEPPAELAQPAPVYLERAPEPDDVAYWVRHLEGFDPAGMALAESKRIVGRPTFAGASLHHALSAPSLVAVGRIQEHTWATRNMILLAAFYLLLMRHGARPDMVVGVPVTTRRTESADVVGFHPSVLPIRVGVHPDDDPTRLMEAVGSGLLSGMEHADASFESVQPAVAGARSSDWRVPTFRHAFNYRSSMRGSHADRPDLTIAGAPVELVTMPVLFSRLDLEWVVSPRSNPDALMVKVTYSTEVHDRAFVELLVDRYEAILVEMADGMHRPVREISGWTSADRAVAHRCNDTHREIPRQTILEQVRAQAERRPDAPAFRTAGSELGYRALIAAADGVREALVDRGVRPGDVVALLADRGPELAAAALGVWAAGATYLPLDPGHPMSRLSDHLADAQARLVLSDRPPEEGLGSGRDWIRLAEVAPSAPPAGDWPVADPGSCAYLIYTSGSTGRPKGVQVSHRNLANLVADFTHRLDVGATDRVLWSTTFSFDISALELLLPLCAGAAVVVAADADRMAADRLLGLVVEEDVTVLQATPTTWRHVAPALCGQLSGRRVLSGGEPLNAALATRLLDDGCRLFNVYGPTETTIWSTAIELTGPVTDPVPLGHPIANTTVHVMDAAGHPVPPGVRGELCIGGEGVALSYRGEPRLTAERFIAAPGLGRLYRTGDEVVLTERGLLFLGRLDRQVKIRGHRVEPAEVEAMLEGHPAVAAAAVIAEPDPLGHLRLVAAVQPAAGVSAPATSALREYLTERLPSGAVPSRYVTLPALPHTDNGKVDHQALARLVRRGDGGAELPADPVLRRLVELWRYVLGDPRLGTDADFFANGGHSLLAVALADRIAAALGVEVGFEMVFDEPSPERVYAALAHRLPTP